MNWWYYEIIVSGEPFAKDVGYETESDAEKYGRIAAEAMGLQEYQITTGQSWEDLD